MVANNRKSQNLKNQICSTIFVYCTHSLLGSLRFFIISHCKLFQHFIHYQSHHSPGNLEPHGAEVPGREVIHKTVLKLFGVVWTFPFLIVAFVVSSAESCSLY